MIKHITLTMAWDYQRECFRWYYVRPGHWRTYVDRARPHGPMKAQRNVHNYVEKCKTSHEAKTEV